MIIEEVTNQSYSSFLNQSIITPLNLTNTTIQPDSQIPTPHMGCYWDIGSWIDLTIINSTTYTGWADITSTTEDLITFHTSLLNGDIINESQLTRMKTINSAANNYGMGMEFHQTNSINYYGHYGEVANTSALFFVDISSLLAPNGYFISYNYNTQGANTTAINSQVINILNQYLSTPIGESNNYTLSPNPTSETCTISLKESSEDRSVAIYDIKGSLIYANSIQANTNNLKLSLSHLEKGIYFLKIQNSTTQHLIIQ
jgi:CubicO group peptidase (beta-lactamase class C family)